MIGAVDSCQVQVLPSGGDRHEATQWRTTDYVCSVWYHPLCGKLLGFVEVDDDDDVDDVIVDDDDVVDDDDD